MTVRVRFAPSPTGYLHVGATRAALFNYLYARQKGGKFLLRIEDTDLARSTDESTRSILEGLAWIGLEPDEEVIFQSNNADKHREAAKRLLDEDKAYRDFRLPEAEKIKYVQSGVDAVDKAISLKGDYIEALVYKNLLLRLQANLEKNPARQQALLKEADTFRNRAEELRKQKAAAPVATPGRGAGRGE